MFALKDVSENEDVGTEGLQVADGEEGQGRRKEEKKMK